MQLINDAIHGPIELSPLLFQIINTREFHRLKDVHQLGKLWVHACIIVGLWQTIPGIIMGSSVV